MPEPIYARSRGELDLILAALMVDGPVLRFSADWEVDTVKTYARNCKEAPADHLISLPGFTGDGFQRDPAAAMEAFAHFCRSKLGQARHFVFITKKLEEIPPPPLRPCPVNDCYAARGCFDGAEDAADNRRLQRGDHAEALPAPCGPEGWPWQRFAHEGRKWWFRADDRWFFEDGDGAWRCYECPKIKAVWWHCEQDGAWFYAATGTQAPPAS